MPSALIKFPFATKGNNYTYKLNTTSKGGLQIPQDCGGPIQRRGGRTVARRRPNPKFAVRCSAPGGGSLVPSGDQPGRKIRQQPGIAGEPKAGIGKPGAEQPVVELRRPFQAKQIADIKRVVERG